MTSGLDGLSDRQRLLLERWLPSAHVVADHSWGLVETTVLEVTHEGPRLIVKAGSEDDHHIERELHKTLAWLSGPHRIAAPTAERLRAQIAGWPTPSAVLTPTHGDWQPRNWLIGDDELVRIIDFGRAAMRAPLTDFGRLAAQDFRRDPRPEAAFLAG